MVKEKDTVDLDQQQESLITDLTDATKRKPSLHTQDTCESLRDCESDSRDSGEFRQRGDASTVLVITPCQACQLLPATSRQEAENRCMHDVRESWQSQPPFINTSSLCITGSTENGCDVYAESCGGEVKGPERTVSEDKVFRAATDFTKSIRSADDLSEKARKHDRHDDTASVSQRGRMKVYRRDLSNLTDRKMFKDSVNLNYEMGQVTIYVRLGPPGWVA